MYIRTKNNIYQVESILRDNGFVKGYNVGEMAFIRKDQVINQSDNLEELCDAIVYYDCDLECMQVTWLKGKNVANFKRYFDYVKMGGIKDVKGAILTKKGIIYIADMNNDGKLVLI